MSKPIKGAVLGIALGLALSAAAPAMAEPLAEGNWLVRARAVNLDFRNG